MRTLLRRSSLFFPTLAAACHLAGCDGGDDTGSGTCVTDAEFVRDDASALLAECAACHTVGGPAGGTALVLPPEDDDATTFAHVREYVTTVRDGAARLRAKPTGRLSHGGGVRFEVLDPAYAVLDELVARAESPGGCASPKDPPMVCDGTPRPGSAPLRRLNATQYAATVYDLLGVAPDPLLLPTTANGMGFRTWPEFNRVSEPGVELLARSAEDLASRFEAARLTHCEDGSDARTCAHGRTLALYERAFRRPLDPAEAALATRFIDTEADLDAAIRMQITMLLQLPQFLYLVAEVDAEQAVPGDADVQVAPLMAHALASRLAYYLSDAPPDATLRDAVDAGELTDPEDLRRHAQRLVDAPTAEGTVKAFHRDWLRAWRIRGGSANTFGTSVLTELDLFTTQEVWNGEPTFDRLIYGTTTWVDPSLARLYGVHTSSSGWARVDVGAERPGVLTHAAFLMSHAHAGASAPVVRGAWVVEQLFCETLAPPLDVNTTLPTVSTENPTIRERLAAHAADPNCASCHDRIDPIGLAFEHFDHMGAWRDTWSDGHPVDATASLAEPPGDVDGAAELVALLGTSERARACYVQRWFEYAVGRAAEDADACTLRDLTARFEASGGNLRDLAVDVTLTDAFRMAPVPRPDDVR